MPDKRYSIYPIEHTDLWDFYKRVKAQPWTADSISWKDDKFEELHTTQQRALKLLLSFFANSDKVVADNIALNLMSMPDIPMEAEFFYAFQVDNENTHAETYADGIEAYIKDYEEKVRMYNAILEMPVVSQKLKWATDWIESGDYGKILVAFAVVEGLLFSSTFAFIFWLRDLGMPLPGLFFSNDEISSDENEHYQFAVHYYKNHYENKLETKVIRQIILEGCEIEKQYVSDYFEDGVKGMNKDKMIQYVEYTTDCILSDFNLDKEFNVSQPLRFMQSLVISGRTNFFEKKDENYTKLSDSSINLEDEDIEW